MMRTSKRALIELIDDLVNEPGPWTEKRDELLSHCSDIERTHIEEFASWFEHME